MEQGKANDGLALTKAAAYRCAAAIFLRPCPLRHRKRCHCPGCGSQRLLRCRSHPAGRGPQRLLRCRSHPAGRGPNSFSLFPPLAAVIAVAPKGRGFGMYVTK